MHSAADNIGGSVLLLLEMACLACHRVLGCGMKYWKSDWNHGGGGLKVFSSSTIIFCSTLPTILLCYETTSMSILVQYCLYK